MNSTAFRLLPARLAAGVAVALMVAGAASSAEVRVRVTNSAVNPVTFSIDGKSKDIRPRKAMTFTVDNLTPKYSIHFANGVADRGELDLSQSSVVVSETDGLEYRCLTLGDDGMEFELSDDCSKKINKPK